MELIWRLRGWVRLRLTSADCASRLGELSREIKLTDIDRRDDLTVEFSVLISDAAKLTARDGERLEQIGRGGLPALLGKLWSWRALVCMVVLLGVLTVFLPTRVWFIRVEGNGALPARYIREQAQSCGVYFGASRRALRSEQVKNHLLAVIPELRWAGVNTEGCTAVITVSVREEQEPAGERQAGDIVAAMDAVVMQVYPQTGTAQVRPGQAVREGQLLISGLTDLGLSTRADRAAGEVYGLTRREIRVQMPEKTAVRRESGRVIRKFSLLLGKKRVNFSNDSGILHGSCVKMRTVNYLTLPGGFELPAALVTETYILCDTVEQDRADADGLTDQARQWVREQMIAGTVLGEELRQEGQTLSAVFECRELIGVFRPGVYLERDTNDRESGER